MTEAKDRWAGDVSRPSGREVRRDLGLRVGLPALVWFGVVVGLGLLLTGPLAALGEREVAVNQWFVEQRTPTLDTVTKVWSFLGNTETVIGLCVLVALIVWWRTRQWWYAATAPLALAVQAAVFMLSALVVGRERPAVELLDAAPPTSSFPSGHTGASTAAYVSLALLAQRIRLAWLRVLLTVVLCLLPLTVGTARLYRGMHHPSDVVVGLLNGLVAVVIGWHWLRRAPAGSPSSAPSSSTDRPADAEEAAR